MFVIKWYELPEPVRTNVMTASGFFEFEDNPIIKLQNQLSLDHVKYGEQDNTAIFRNEAEFQWFILKWS